MKPVTLEALRILGFDISPEGRVSWSGTAIDLQEASERLYAAVGVVNMDRCEREAELDAAIQNEGGATFEESKGED